MLPSNQKAPKKKRLVKKPSKVARLKPSATSAIKLKQAVVQKLKKHYPDAHCELDYNNPFELLIATILSAQCTDVRVNQVTPFLFSRFPDARALSRATQDEVEEIIRSTGFYKNKAKNLIACSQKLEDRFAGQVPAVLEDLIQLDGVGRKTANVVLGNAFNITSGIVVDTHVTRLSQRLDWTKSEDPHKIEQDLQKFIDHDDWILISHLLIFHGRRVCKARSPDCESCFLFDLCPKKNV